jgi:hypothetical protein
MFPMANTGFFKRGGEIPTPEAGVCTVYPVAIPVSSDILGYYSVFNSCDNFKLNDGTGVITADNDAYAYTNDLSGNSNDLAAIGTVPSSARGAFYQDDGGGNVFWKNFNDDLGVTGFRANPAWRLNTDVKTVIFLVRSSALNTSQRLGFHYLNGMLRFTNSRQLQLFGSGNMTFSASVNTWMVVSCRCDGNVLLGIDKTYEEVLATPPSIANSDFTLWSPDGVNFSWIGDMREIAIYSESLSDAQMDTMVDYMKDKWGL